MQRGTVPCDVCGPTTRSPTPEFQRVHSRASVHPRSTVPTTLHLRRGRSAVTTSRPALRLPADPLAACRVLCDALVALGPVDDHDGRITDRLKEAHTCLVRARPRVQACLPRRGDDWVTVFPDCTCDENTRLKGHHPPPCLAGTGLPVHVKDAGDKGCLAHRRAGRFVLSDPQRRGLCRSCRAFRDRYGRIPPPVILDRLDAGYDITPTMITEALSTRKAKKAPAPKPRKREPSRRERMQARIGAAAARIAGR